MTTSSAQSASQPLPTPEQHEEVEGQLSLFDVLPDGSIVPSPGAEAK